MSDSLGCQLASYVCWLISVFSATWWRWWCWDHSVSEECGRKQLVSSNTNYHHHNIEQMMFFYCICLLDLSIQQKNLNQYSALGAYLVYLLAGTSYTVKKLKQIWVFRCLFSVFACWKKLQQKTLLIVVIIIANLLFIWCRFDMASDKRRGRG